MSLVGPRPEVPGFADLADRSRRPGCSPCARGSPGRRRSHFRNEEQLLAATDDPEAYNRDVLFPTKVRMNLEYIRDVQLPARPGGTCGGPCDDARRPMPERLAVDGGDAGPHHAVPALAALRRGRDRGGRPRSCGPAGSTTGPATRAARSSRSSPRTTGCRYAVALANGSLALELALRVPRHRPGRRGGRHAAHLRRLGQLHRARRRARRSSPTSTPTAADHHRRDASPRPSPRGPAPSSPSTSRGWPCDMPAIMALAAERGLKVIEDCAQAHGATIDGRPVGTFGDVAAFSFCQDKIITTGGEGGISSLRDRDLWSAAWSFKDHGKSWDRVYATDHPPGFRWLHESFGTNWRLTESRPRSAASSSRKLDALGRRTPPARRTADGGPRRRRRRCAFPIPPPSVRPGLLPVLRSTSARSGSAPDGTVTGCSRPSRPKASRSSPGPAPRCTSRARSRTGRSGHPSASGRA